MTVLGRLRRKYDVVAREAAKFGAVGAVNTVLDFAVLNLLVFGVGLAPLRSKVLSTVVAATSSYLMNRHWTFRHRDRQDVRREYVLFFLLNAVGLAIALVVLGVVRYGLDQDSALALNAANVVGLGLGTVFRFWSYRRFVWTRPNDVAGAAEDGDVLAAVALDLDEDEDQGRARAAS
ncbi:MAG: GtrA family protein [Actinomycetota bacterium]|nr:GtrA family protein [Actinomycetota bacterium]